MRTLPTGIYALLSSEFYGNYPILAASLVLFSCRCSCSTSCSSESSSRG